MRTITAALLQMIIATASPGASFVEDGLGFVLEPTEGIAFQARTSGSFEQVRIHLCIFEPSLGGVSGWECAVEVDGSPVAPSWQLAAGLDVAYDEQVFQVGIGLGSLALRPGPGGVVPIATWSGFVSDPDDAIAFFIGPYPESISFDGDPGYGGPDDASDLQALITPGEFRLPDFVINGSGDSPYQNKTWGEVKALYR